MHIDRVLLALAAVFAVTNGDRPNDIVTEVPGFNATAFRVYSGYLDIPGPFQMTDYGTIAALGGVDTLTTTPRCRRLVTHSLPVLARPRRRVLKQTCCGMASGWPRGFLNAGKLH